MSTSGVISGTPTGAGTSNFIVKVTDSSNPAQTATANLSITVTGNLMITTTDLPNGVEGIPYSASITASGGTPPYTFSLALGALPPGLSLSTSGVISGTVPIGIGGFWGFDVQVTDSSNPAQTATASLSIQIRGVLTITTTILPNGVEGSPYSATVTAIGGDGLYTFSISSGNLPAGLSLSTNGVISGTPSGPVGKANFIVQVHDSSPPVQSAKARLSITVSNPVRITTTILPTAEYTIPYSATIKASGGTRPYTFAITGGALPFGLSMSTSGVISGTPTQPGQTANFTVQVTDSSNPAQTATANLSITVVFPLAITTTALPGGTVGQAYSATIAASGGIPPYTFSIIHGSLPNGLSLSASGVISGTPTSTGTSNFTVQVKDSSNPVLKATANLSITVPP